MTRLPGDAPPDAGAAARQIMEVRLAFWGKLAARVAVLALAGYILWRLRSTLTTVAVALILASATGSLVDSLCRTRVFGLKRHTQRLLATILVFGGLAWILYTAVLLFLSPFEIEFGKFIKNYPAYQTALAEKLTLFQEWYANLSPGVRQMVDEQKTRLSLPSPSEFLANGLRGTVTWASHAVELLIVPVLAFYFTLDGKSLRNQFMFLVPSQKLRPTLAILSESGAIMRAYLASQFWLALIAGVTVGVTLRLLGMDYALILGVMAGVTRAIPIIGPLIGGIPIVLLSFIFGAQTGQPYLWVAVLLGFTVLHLVESKFIMPKFLGHALNLHAAVILIALLIGGEFFGLMGMFLAAPLAALVRVLLVHYVVRPRMRAHLAASHSPRLSIIGGGSGRFLRLERAASGRAASSMAVSPALSTKD